MAMKAGIAYTHDLGLQQDHRHHSFGNYITIDHGNGEFSHYAHLATGTFVVQERRARGARAGARDGRQQRLHAGRRRRLSRTRQRDTRAADFVRRAFRSSSRICPIGRAAAGYRTVVSSNASPLCDCGSRAGCCRRRGSSFGGAILGRGFGGAMVERSDRSVSRGSKVLEVTLSWAGAPGDLDLHLMSPSGRHYSARMPTPPDIRARRIRSLFACRIRKRACGGSRWRACAGPADQFRRGNVGDVQVLTGFAASR